VKRPNKEKQQFPVYIKQEIRKWWNGGQSDKLNTFDLAQLYVITLFGCLASRASTTGVSLMVV